MWAGRRVLLGVSGGIASYQSCYLVRRLTEAGASVDVLLTPSAAEFVRPLTFDPLARMRPAEPADLLATETAEQSLDRIEARLG